MDKVFNKATDLEGYAYQRKLYQNVIFHNYATLIRHENPCTDETETDLKTFISFWIEMLNVSGSTTESRGYILPTQTMSVWYEIRLHLTTMVG